MTENAVNAAGWQLVNTGGNCTAFEMRFPNGLYLLVTSETDPSAPETMTERVVMGAYDSDSNPIFFLHYEDFPALLDSAGAEYMWIELAQPD